VKDNVTTAIQPDPSRATIWVTKLLATGEPVCFTAHGPSMNPVIPDGTTVLVVPVVGNPIRPGCVLLYRQHGRLILHRCIRQDRERRCWMTGDAGLRGGEWIASDAILGIAESMETAGHTRQLNSLVARSAGRLHYYTRPWRRLALLLYRCRNRRHGK
jgi:hypothetical protein